VTLIEDYEGADGADYQVNTLLELAIGDEASVERVKINREGDKALHVGTLLAAAGAGARIDDFSFNIGGAVVRNQIAMRFEGEGIEAAVRGASLLKDRQHADNTMVIDHAVGRCTGRELFKSVLDGESRAVFQGKIIVRQDAQKTDGKMSSHALLLSEGAEADHKPELEIFADDVVCGHGATAGALDEDLLFYLKARGIPQKEAEALMVQGFIGEVVEGVGNEAVREALMQAVREWLKERA
jgi:Fe-S cluster assembly protein SufD